MAVIAHPDTLLTWTATGYSSEAGARNEALDACGRTMGEGCYIGAAWSNNAKIVVVEDAAANLYVRGGDFMHEVPLTAAMNECEQISTGCRISGSFINSFEGPRRFFPTGTIPRRVFASVARPKKGADPKWDVIAWLSSGHSGFMAAEKAALAQCRSDTGVDCEIRVSVGNGRIGRAYDDSLSTTSWLSISAEKAIEKQLNACSKRGRPCYLIDTFDVFKPGTFRIDMTWSQTALGGRGFYSLARPVDDSAEKVWGKRVLVTGRASREEAQAAAVERCQAESRVRCMATPQDGEDGMSQFIVLYRDGQGILRRDTGITEAGVRHSKQELCAKEGRQCSEGVLIDLRKPVTTTLQQF